MAYTPLALFKTYANVHQDDEQVMLVYLDTAEAIIEQYLNYSPEYQHYTSRLNGNGGYAISLKAKPIHTIQEVIIDSVHVPVEEFYIDEQFLYSKGVIFSYGRNHNVIVSYTAGYDTAAAATATDEDDTVIDGGDAFSDYAEDSEAAGALIVPQMPKIITMTVLRIASILESESNSNIGVTSKSFGDSGSRSFINYTNFDKYLLPINGYRLLSI
jgi:hypothetical protein